LQSVALIIDMITREKLEEKQIWIYIGSLIMSVILGLLWTKSTLLEYAIEPIIGVLLYSMFCQIPFLALKKAFTNRAFFQALLFGNFVLIPILVYLLISVFALSPLISLGVLLVLLTPCIDYVIVFSHLGKADSKSILAATPLLFVCQLLLLPIYLWLFLGKEAMGIIELWPFVKAFLYLIVIPFVLSVLTQLWAQYSPKRGQASIDFSAWLPVPFMALTFFFVIASQIAVVFKYAEFLLNVVPVYVSFAILAPFMGVLAAKLFKVNTFGTRAVSFSTSTRNSLVVLPLAFALPAPQNQLVAVVIVTQTIVEIFFELLYIKVIPIAIKDKNGLGNAAA